MPVSWPIGAGEVVLDGDGTPVQFRHPADAARRYLLDPATEPWHGPAHGWGTGFVLTPAGAGRWQAPRAVDRRDGGLTARHEPLAGLELTVERTAGEVFRETYRWTNTGADRIELTGLGLNTPVRDLYDTAATSLAQACHAHVFTGGAWAWLLAEPMSGTPPLLGTIVRDGALWAYSIESRNTVTSSDIRGHVVVHPTDHARNPSAFGGQPVFALEPGESWTLGWEIGWYDDRAAFLAAVDAPADLPLLAATTGDTLGLTLADRRTQTVSSTEHGIRYVDLVHAGRASRTAVAFHAPVRELAEARVREILTTHRPAERAEPDRYAFVPVDTRTGLRQTENGWADWSDGAERIGMAALLVETRRRGWSDPDALDQALHGFAAYARARLINPDGSVRRGSSPAPERHRLYNTPWLAQFFVDRFHLYDEADDLELATYLLESADALGARDHLSIGQPEALVAVAAAQEAYGDKARADRLRAALLDQADRFVARGTGLPAHEVNYEQSMVAPLVSLLALAHDLRPDGGVLDALREAVRWLRAFGGPQPHVRLRDIGIRHWDGYWFGLNRQWGDTFPHYWSVLTAVALTQLPPALRTPGSDATADAIFRANLVDFAPDGRATCAYVLPSCVDGVPADQPDPLANDQDWALTLYLRTATP